MNQPSNTLSLLSGGEKTMAATAMILAVFLQNPSPICVLDEVDAPLDDINIDKYCKVIKKINHDTSTKFIIITHNPITMANMDRLYGVTMAETGISKLIFSGSAGQSIKLPLIVPPPSRSTIAEM
jgi:chromosome segregation protein